MKKKMNNRILAVIMAVTLSGTAAIPAMGAEFTDKAAAEIVLDDSVMEAGADETAAEPVFDAGEIEVEAAFSDSELPAGEVSAQDGEDSEVPEEAPLTVTLDGIDYEYIPSDIPEEEGVYKVVKGADREQVIIPEKVYGRYVSTIGEGAFANCKNLKGFGMRGYGRKMVIEKGAFEDCENLRTVSVPDGFRLESNAFKNCPKLFRFYGGDGRLLGQSSLAEDTFDEDTKIFFSIGEYSYSSEVYELLHRLGIFVIAQVDTSDIYEEIGKVTYLQEYGSELNVRAADFDDSCKIVRITDEDWLSPITIGRKAFYGTGVEEVVLSEKVEEIETKAFYGCKNLKRIIIPESVTSIADDAFDESLRTVIYAPRGSYALEYAKENGIAYKEYGSESIKAPAKLTYTRSKNNITLNWSHVPYADKYQIYKYDCRTKKHSRVATVNNGAQHTYTTYLSVGDTVKFRVRAYSESDIYSDNYGPFSSVVTVKSAPGQVGKVKGVYNEKTNRVTFTWEKPLYAEGYVVYRSAEKYNKGYVRVKSIKGGSATKYIDTDVEKGNNYHYRVSAYRMLEGKRVYGTFSDPYTVKCR